ncbi:SDR family NAD(P)-dependent oxidoreductase [Noviherbaspirillum sp. UKPF54]|uniref:SDR family NAD(P)-dependent oxidoreductase n=1 Tax=Noviherbaspirillum sp. UKPF54 TaxID=2601898 RepID=UPI0011B1707B|nr:SDR family NAD(P)-dependent oxidoreductase [Noviherbaspirillum sp. UKPF54]QDZ29589.1 SDR family NAD(P)-dependent oxidoreductase [Noviherbaspirillum sp. UKPF54]
MNRPQRYAVVTGAASGIGLALVALLVKRGWTVGMFDIDHVALHDAVRRLGNQAVALPADVSDPAAVRSAFGHFEGLSVGRLDLLVNCAALLYTGHFEDMPPRHLAHLLAVNNVGLALCCQAALPLLSRSAEQHRAPAVVNLSSASAVYGIPSMALYSASKFWVRGFTEALAVEWARHGIAVRDVMPPFVDTPMLRGRDDNLFVRRLGVSLSAGDVAHQVLAAARGGPLHRPVSWHLKALLLASHVIPAAVIRAALAFAGGYPRANAGR